MPKSFLESDSFMTLLPLIDEKARYEKLVNGHPPHWNMIFWKTRKPLISARAFIAASLLPEEFSKEDFIKITRLEDKKPFAHNPTTNGMFTNITLLDPFSGFGSIPLEAMRLGVGKVIASDFLPTTNIFLKAILVYPRYGDRLLTDIKKYRTKIEERLKEKVKHFYNDVDGYIGGWEIKCPYCGVYTPLISQSWIIKPSGKSGKRAVYLEVNVDKEKKRVDVKVVDSIKQKVDLKKAELAENVKGNVARCLYCNSTFPGKGDHWYVKDAIKEWFRNLDEYINGNISLDQLKESRARPRLFVKFKGKEKASLVFEEISDEDINRFWDLYKELNNIDITLLPTEETPAYETLIFRSWGIDKYYKVFTPRQLLVFTFLLNILQSIRYEVDDKEYADAIITYLLIAMLNHIRYNCMLTSIDSTTKFIREATAFTKFMFSWNWVDVSPLTNLTGSLNKSLDHVEEALKFLIENYNDKSTVKVIMSDVLDLEIDPSSIDVIVTDPPYAHDVPYSEWSDFYYVWIKRLFEYPYDTQWRALAPKEIGENPDRAKYFGDNIGKSEYFRERLSLAFVKLSNLLKDNGILVTFYNNTKSEAWTSLIYAGWYFAKLRISSVHAITTEDPNRVNAQDAISLDKSIVIVWRKKAEGQKLIQEATKEAIKHASDWVSNKLLRQEKIKKISLDIYIEILGKVLETLTKYEKLPGLKGEGVEAVKTLIENYAFPATAQALVEGLAKGLGVKINDPYAIFYVLVKLLLPPMKKVRKTDDDTAIFLKITGNINEKELKEKGIVVIEKGTIILNEPENDGTDTSSILASLEKLPHVRDAINGKYEFKTPVQLLHYLEYEALKHSDKLQQIINDLRDKTRFVDDAIAMAKIFAEVLSDNDVEKEPCKRIVGKKDGILKYTS